MSAIIDNSKLVRKSSPNIMSMLNKKVDEYKLTKAWHNRNVEHGEVMMESLEVEYHLFHQNIFIEDTKEINEKLTRIGFTSLYGFPDEKLFESFSRIMYNSKYNIAISLFKPENKEAIYTAKKIVDKSIVDSNTAMAVFLASISVLMDKKTSSKKQILME